jgi:hypothetical protein
VLESVAIGSWGREASFAVRAAALYCVAVDLETAHMDAWKLPAGLGVPNNCASDVDIDPVAGNNWFEARSIHVEATSNLIRAAVVEPGIACNDLWKAAVGSGARANHLRIDTADPRLPKKAKPVAGCAGLVRGWRLRSRRQLDTLLPLLIGLLFKSIFSNRRVRRASRCERFG